MALTADPLAGTKVKVEKTRAGACTKLLTRMHRGDFVSVLE
jgi:hypothetical protein